MHNNPLDATFFRFFFGFVAILLISFAIFYVVDHFSSSLDAQAAIILK